MIILLAVLGILLCIFVIALQAKADQLSVTRSNLLATQEALAQERAQQAYTLRRADNTARDLALARQQLRAAAGQLALTEARCQILLNAAEFHQNMRHDLQERHREG